MQVLVRFYKTLLCLAAISTTLACLYLGYGLAIYLHDRHVIISKIDGEKVEKNLNSTTLTDKEWCEGILYVAMGIAPECDPDQLAYFSQGIWGALESASYSAWNLHHWLPFYVSLAALMFLLIGKMWVVWLITGQPALRIPKFRFGEFGKYYLDS